MGLNLNISHYSLAKPLSQFLNDVSKIKDNHSKLFEIDGYVGKLEEERKKIDVFKRELPLCMLLMNEAIERLKQEASSVQGVELETDNKKNWMSSAQLWISNTNSQFQSHPLHPAKILTASDQHGLLDRETQNLISLSRSDSPQGPLVDRGCWFSNNGGHSSEEEEKSDGRSWRSGPRRKRQGLGS
ncbi:hypothetical protein DY000_02028039 [Brassica cretica]|uniref:HHO5-like N-terminal domain-containing protein n=1 Tax=Brassica cretica TaxID=69181 RepID=A0ABQ7E5Y1_BRACR|nr:hypothetical protein DY000_02028039 [Brassica cretica]